MDKFTRVEGVAAYLPEANIDTDIIYPARFLLLMDRDGLGRYAFHDKRFSRDGRATDDFILNQQTFSSARILIAGANFGCGSSREQAVWALSGFGIRCVIAPSFGDIFFANCGKNGVLAITLATETVLMLGEHATREARFAIDLERQTISVSGAETNPFHVAPDLKAALLNGWDDTDRILQGDGEKIAAFERRHRDRQPWLFDEGPFTTDPC